MASETIICDSDYQQDWPIVDDNDNPIDVSGWLFEAKCVRDGKCITLTSGNGVSIIDGPAGRIRISMTAAQTKSFGPGTSRWLLWRTDSGHRVAIAEGSATFEGKLFDA